MTESAECNYISGAISMFTVLTFSNLRDVYIESTALLDQTYNVSVQRFKVSMVHVGYFSEI